MEHLIENAQDQHLVEKWKPILEHTDFDPIKDTVRLRSTAIILENTTNAIKENPGYVPMTSLLETTQASGTGGFTSAAAATGPSAGFDPVLISLIRRSMPNLVAYDVAGVQPMTQPAGLVFALRPQYRTDPANSATWTDSGFNEPDTDYSGTGTHEGAVGTADTANTGTGWATGDGEQLGVDGGTAIPEMGFSIEKALVDVKTRALKAEYTTEMAQDLKKAHGLDAETELSNILASQILAEINREVIRTIYNTAVTGSIGAAANGVFDLDVDANGRWAEEKFKGLYFQIEREANAVGKGTRRGKGNIVICSSDVASALQMAGILSYAPDLANKLSVDDTGNTFAGVLRNGMKVYVDPFSGGNYMVVGYKGSGSMDAGLFYCPYVPLERMVTTGENTFQPKMAFKTRYGLVANPFAQGASAGVGVLAANSNRFYRRTRITNLM